MQPVLISSLKHVDRKLRTQMKPEHRNVAKEMILRQISFPDLLVYRQGDKTFRLFIGACDIEASTKVLALSAF
jgi:hypothetical protein